MAHNDLSVTSPHWPRSYPFSPSSQHWGPPSHYACWLLTQHPHPALHCARGSRGHPSQCGLDLFLEKAACIWGMPPAAIGLLAPDVRSASVSVSLSQLFAMLIPKHANPGGPSDWPVLGETLESVFTEAPPVVLAVSTSRYH